jgi:hypothetical protein
VARARSHGPCDWDFCKTTAVSATVRNSGSFGADPKLAPLRPFPAAYFVGPLAETLAGELAAAHSENEKAPSAGAFRVERAGIEPATSGLQSRRSPS